MWGSLSELLTAPWAPALHVNSKMVVLLSALERLLRDLFLPLHFPFCRGRVLI